MRSAKTILAVVALGLVAVVAASGRNGDRVTLPLDECEAETVAWRSMRYHGGDDELPIELDPTATGSAVSTEPRRDGLCKLEVDIVAGGTVTLVGTIEAEDLTLGGTIAATSQTLIDNGGGNYTLVAEWSGGLPDQRCYEIDLTGKLSCTITNDPDCQVRVLAGDVNSSGRTNLTDVAFAMPKKGYDPAEPGKARFDVNVDGNINLIDMALIKSLNGGSAAPAPGAGAPATIALEVNGSSTVNYADVAGGFYLDVVLTSADPAGMSSFGLTLTGHSGFAYDAMEEFMGTVLNYCGGLSSYASRPDMPDNGWHQGAGLCIPIDAGALPMEGPPDNEVGTGASDYWTPAQNGLAAWLEFSQLPPPGRRYAVGVTGAYIGDSNCEDMAMGDADFTFVPLTIVDEEDCNDNGIPDECDIDCGEFGGPCDIPGCGTRPDGNGNRIPDECDPVITSWASVRTHGEAGDLAIELDPSASGMDVVSETRRGGVQRIEVDFDADVSGLVVGTIEAEDLTPGGTIPASNQYTINAGLTLVVEFDPGLPDETCYQIDLAGKIAGLVGDTDCRVRVLAGDTNGDEYTALIDMAQTKSKNGSDPTVPGNARFDVNTDGNINLIDMALVKSLNGHSVTCP